MDLNQAYTLNNDIVYRLVTKEAVILDINSGEYFSLNKTGTEVFLDIVNNKSLNSIFEKQKKKYKKERNLKKDIISLIEELLKKKII